jgi:hypothetical protein
LITLYFEAKAKSELARLPPTEKVLFDACYNDAKTPVDLAKCLRRLLQQRERNHAQVVIQGKLLLKYHFTSAYFSSTGRATITICAAIRRKLDFQCP